MAKVIKSQNSSNEGRKCRIICGKPWCDILDIFSCALSSAAVMFGSRGGRRHVSRARNGVNEQVERASTARHTASSGTTILATTTTSSARSRGIILVLRFARHTAQVGSSCTGADPFFPFFGLIRSTMNSPMTSNKSNRSILRFVERLW